MRIYNFLFAALYEFGKRGLRMQKTKSWYSVSQKFNKIAPGLVLYLVLNFNLMALWLITKKLINIYNIEYEGLLISVCSMFFIGLYYYKSQNYLHIYKQYKSSVTSLKTISIIALMFIYLMGSLGFLIIVIHSLS